MTQLHTVNTESSVWLTQSHQGHHIRYILYCVWTKEMTSIVEAGNTYLSFAYDGETKFEAALSATQVFLVCHITSTTCTAVWTPLEKGNLSCLGNPALLFGKPALSLSRIRIKTQFKTMSKLQLLTFRVKINVTVCGCVYSIHNPFPEYSPFLLVTGLLARWPYPILYTNCKHCHFVPLQSLN